MVHNSRDQNQDPTTPPAAANVLDAALQYLDLGLSVIPLCAADHVGVGRDHGRRCQSRGKAPLVPWAAYQTRRPTADEVRGWWRRWPNCNLGIVLGEVSGVVRIDVDGQAALDQLLQLNGGMPNTWAFKSGRADGFGYGFLFAIPTGVTLATTPETTQAGELRLQARGSQTVAPPSRHRD